MNRRETKARRRKKRNGARTSKEERFDLGQSHAQAGPGERRKDSAGHAEQHEEEGRNEGEGRHRPQNGKEAHGKQRQPRRRGRAKNEVDDDDDNDGDDSRPAETAGPLAAGVPDRRDTGEKDTRAPTKKEKEKKWREPLEKN